jgi:hypothetical protein
MSGFSPCPRGRTRRLRRALPSPPFPLAEVGALDMIPRIPKLSTEKAVKPGKEWTKVFTLCLPRVLLCSSASRVLPRRHPPAAMTALPAAMDGPAPGLARLDHA